MEANQKKSRIKKINIIITSIYVLAAIIINHPLSIMLNLGQCFFAISLMLLVHAILLYFIAFILSIINRNKAHFKNNFVYFANIYIVSFLVNLILGLGICSNSNWH